MRVNTTTNTTRPDTDYESLYVHYDELPPARIWSSRKLLRAQKVYHGDRHFIGRPYTDVADKVVFERYLDEHPARFITETIDIPWILPSENPIAEAPSRPLKHTPSRAELERYIEAAEARANRKTKTHEILIDTERYFGELDDQSIHNELHRTEALLVFTYRFDHNPNWYVGLVGPGGSVCQPKTATEFKPHLVCMPRKRKGKNKPPYFVRCISPRDSVEDLEIFYETAKDLKAIPVAL